VAPAPAAPAPSGWIITIGAEGHVEPSYEGADHYHVVPAPIFDFRRAGTPPNFRSPIDGFGISLIDLGSLKVGPVGKLIWQRKESDFSELHGLGDVDWTVEVGGFVEFWPAQWLRTRVEARQGIGGHHGQVFDLSADFISHVTPQLQLNAGPRLGLATSNALSPYFSVTPAQSIASGLPVFDAGGGLRYVGVGAQATYYWTPQWTTNVFVEYQRLLGDVADSPLVSLRGSADQVTAGVGLSYSFNWAGFQ
jgi:outer membrane protein